MALGSDLRVFGAGELDAWFRRGGVNLDVEDTKQTALWDAIRNRLPMTARTPTDAYWRGLEHYRALLTCWLPTSRGLKASFAETNRQLFSAIASEVGCTVVVDSSHYPLRAYHLWKLLPELDLRVIWLTRNPWDVVTSFGSRDVQTPKNPVRANLYLVVSYWLSRYVSRRSDLPVARLRYEDFVADPELAIEALAKTLELPLAPVLSEPLDGSLMYQGNRLRRAENVRITPQAAGPRRWWPTSLLQFFAMRNLGYRRTDA
jgi:hypothetical protein